MDRGAWWATVHGVAKSRTRLSDDAHHSSVIIVILSSFQIIYLCDYKTLSINYKSSVYSRGFQIGAVFFTTVSLVPNTVSWTLAVNH